MIAKLESSSSLKAYIVRVILMRRMKRLHIARTTNTGNVLVVDRPVSMLTESFSLR